MVVAIDRPGPVLALGKHEVGKAPVHSAPADQGARRKAKMLFAEAFQRTLVHTGSFRKLIAIGKIGVLFRRLDCPDPCFFCAV